MRVQTGAAFSSKEAAKFQREIRAGLEATAEQRYRDELARLDGEIKKQKAECGQETAQEQERLDMAVADEAVALARAKTDKSRAEEARKAATHRLSVAKKLKRAQGVQKRRTCKVEEQGIKDKKTATRAHHQELKQIERSLRRRKKPLSTSKERLAERRDEVESNIPDNFVPLWHKVRRSFRIAPKQEGRISLTEAFTQYAEENPDDVLAAQQEAAHADFARMEREARKGGGRKSKTEAAKAARTIGREERLSYEDIPF
jgi:hypothetical protein